MRGYEVDGSVHAEQVGWPGLVEFEGLPSLSRTTGIWTWERMRLCI